MNKPKGADHPIFLKEDKLLMLAIITLVASVTFSLGIFHGGSYLLGLFGVFGLFAGPTYLLLSLWEYFRYKKTWKILAAIVLLASATVIAWGTAFLYLFRKI
jgi:hypothetical protein